MGWIVALLLILAGNFIASGIGLEVLPQCLVILLGYTIWLGYKAWKFRAKIKLFWIQMLVMSLLACVEIAFLVDFWGRMGGGFRLF